MQSFAPAHPTPPPPAEPPIRAGSPGRAEATSFGPPPVFTVVCVSHRPDVLERWLLPSLRSQPQEAYEFRLIDSRTRPARSCAAGLNAGAAGARGRYLMFVHHDVAWDDPNFLADVAARLDQVPNLGVAGVAGVEGRAGRPYAVPVNAVLAGERPGMLVGEPITDTRPVEAVDELLLIVPTDQFGAQAFDEAACDDWHLYGVDYCLTAARRGRAVVALPFVVRHRSPGSPDRAFFRTLDHLRRKHRGHARLIRSTVGVWRTGGPDGLAYVCYRCGGLVRLGLRQILAAAYALPPAVLPPAVRRKQAAWVRWRRAVREHASAAAAAADAG
ncbi:MAG: hypothetical protein JWO31_837 [Phycisphaerales bacterium]|nr:hypothetical protein [Phycisphaerales bacterium]